MFIQPIPYATDRLANTADERLLPRRSASHLQWPLQAASSGGTVWHFGGAGEPGRAPQFGLEPPALVEYSNSSGSVISCRPAQQVGAAAAAEQQLVQSGQKSLSSGEHQRRSSLAEAPISISWHLVRPSSQQVASEEQQLDEGLSVIHSNAEEAQLINEAPNENGSANNKPKSPLVRQDGSLVLSPFKASQYRPEVHSATYRCCLANQFGALCSRPVRTRAGEYIVVCLLLGFCLAICRLLCATGNTICRLKAAKRKRKPPVVRRRVAR